VIKPELPDLRSTLRADVETDPPTFGSSDYRYRWLVNKNEVSREAILPLKSFRQGDIVSVEVMLPHATNSTAFAPVTATVKIGNHPPVITTVRLLPLPVFAGEAIRAEVVSDDIDGDIVNLTYEWQINRQPVPANDRDTLEGDQIHSADKVVVFVTPSDPFSKGIQQVSPLVTVSNRFPEIISLPPREDKNGRYHYQVVAKDQDGDQLQYLLLEGPPGMKIDPDSGLIDWEVVPFSKEQSRVRIVVDDSKGGKATQSFPIEATVP